MDVGTLSHLLINSKSSLNVMSNIVIIGFTVLSDKCIDYDFEVLNGLFLLLNLLVNVINCISYVYYFISY